ncbi:GNAT family N-acetyltransferase [Paractinoplanes brasiliensis]|uniref:Acetyltransferase (GNAT) family protein n=1 Tax=Paractinoplanes brasiliensis TaxID=52695 RepID=A0A4R6JLR4_9ACTN|nr:GNAT family N-acetyltransferase [Actinoplanes brasiliensis]TDO37079.1 acetyltransferase (GNAT) family protein [Actinoplanes brasiliensis]GID32227.1 hypothetical protein Abr02nite_72100 [Actinoplanes brasiliensis]
MIRSVATEYGRSQSLVQPFMIRAPVGPPRSGAGWPAEAIRAAGPADRPTYLRTFSASFGVPEAFGASILAPALFEVPWATCYLAELDGRPVATGLGIFVGHHIGVYNIATVPSHRRRGLGQAMTERVVADGAARGAQAAFLQPTPPALRLYESLGFVVAETWTLLHG